MPGLKQDRVVTAAVGLAFVSVLTAIFWEKLAYDDLSGDGAQAFYLSKSVLENGLPNWSLENGFFGFQLSFMLFAFPNALSIHVFGPHEIAIRLPLILYLGLIYCLAVAMVCPPGSGLSRCQRTLACSSVALFLLFSSFLFGHYATYQPYFADLAEPTTTDVFFTLLLFTSIHALTTRSYRLYVAANLAMTTALPSGPLWVGLITLSALVHFDDQRRSVLTCFGAFLAGYLALGLLYLGYQQIHPMGAAPEYSWPALIDRVASTVAAADGAAFWFMLKYSLLTCGIVPLLAVWLHPRFDPFSRFIVTLCLSYAALTVFMGPVLHYLIPCALVLPIAMQRFLFSSAGSYVRRWLIPPRC